MSFYDHKEIEQKWRTFWKENETYKVEEDYNKEKFYVLDMFPYPSGAGLHVGHPLGYIASDIYARYKKAQGFNVLHPMGYDSFGLPAEQYAIQTGQHPAITTENNIATYRRQLDQIGFGYDWSREVRTSDPKYYKWTQWIFKEIFNSWYNKDSNKAESIETLTAIFEKEGNANVNAVCDDTNVFSADTWNGWDVKEQRAILMNYRLAYLADSWVNWCPALGTVLANDEVKDGVSERGGHPVEQKLMRQWSMRITAYADRLLSGLDQIDFTDSLKEQQRNWIGKSKGASVFFQVENSAEKIEVFTTRPDTIFGVTFMVLAPENELVDKITTAEYQSAVADYKQKASLKTERDRQANVKEVTGQFTGAYALHPFTGEKVQIWIGEYVLAGYGTGAVMAVPAGDQRDYDFAKHFNIPIPNIFEGVDISEVACADKDVKLCNSDFLNGLDAYQGIEKAVEEIEKRGFGKGKINFRLRDAIFSRQRYWGEPFPVFYQDDVPYLIEDALLPVTLPQVDKYLPTEDGEPPLARAKEEDWEVFAGDRMEYNTMPGWAGSSWYFLRYMDPHNETDFADKKKLDYWNQVDLYIGGAEHATGHLLYSRFWTKFLYDRGFISFEEPFKKLINQGMILGNSGYAHRLKEGNDSYVIFLKPGEERVDKTSRFFIADSEGTRLYMKDLGLEENTKVFISYELIKQYGSSTSRLPVNINYLDNDKMDIQEVSDWMGDFEGAVYVCSGGYWLNGTFYSTNEKGNNIFKVQREVEKMSKSKYNVQTPDELVEKFGADTLRCYEMFLGPLEQFKPWDVKGINGVNNFLRKFWRLFHADDSFTITEGEADKAALKTLHKTIKRVTEDLDRYSFNTVVSTMMIAVNELNEQNCNNKHILENMVILLSPYAPHIAEELWAKLGHNTSVTKATWPNFDEAMLVENSFEYPVSFNGKMRFKIELPTNLSKEEVEKEVLAAEKTAQYLEGKTPKKIIVVPQKIVNVVV
ncbi:MAG: leucine--tRNA ligase [Flavobacteriales bacterium]|nr:leucine--tRNA ligase [Flavobacteriales bacterium]MCB9196854.1 leucine--tRNA ligase [Flavobacteriales bacterium]